MFLFLGRGHVPTIDDVIRTVIRAACAVTRERRLSVATANRAAFLECGGKRSATPLFLCSASRAFAIIWRSIHRRNHTRMEKRRHHFALPAQFKMRLGTHDDAIVRVIYLLRNCRLNGSVDDKAGITRLRSGHDRFS
jgi:hypothetical protein